MHMRGALHLSSVLVVILLLAVAGAAGADGTEDDVLAVMHAANVDLKAMWLDYRLESIEYLTVGQGRAGSRIHQQPFRWVDGDPRRGGRSGHLSFLIDGSWGAVTSSGVPAGAAEAAVRRAVKTWAQDACLDGVTVAERAWEGGDVTVTDSFLGSGDFGDPFVADVVIAGWVSAGAPLFRDDTLAVSATYVFIDRTTGEPTDLDGDGRMDVALNEVWFNDAFDWQVNAEPPALDVETAALHELGHALSLGHFGSPPAAVMNPVYTGPLHRLEPMDHAGLCTLWAPR